MICPLLSIIFFFDTKNFLENRRVPLQSFSFRSCETKNFDKTVKLPPSFAWKFSIPEFFRNTEVFFYEFYRHWDKNFSTEFSDIPLLCIKFFAIRNFLKHRTVPQRIFSALCDKSFRRRKVIPRPPSLMHKNFRYPKFFDTPKCSNKIFRYCETKNLKRKVMMPPLLHRIWKISGGTDVRRKLS